MMEPGRRPGCPALFWTEERVALLRRMASEGATVHDMAAVFDAPSGRAIYRVLERNGIKLGRKRRGATSVPILMDVAPEHRWVLTRAAKTRGINWMALVRQLVATVCAEPSLIDAVLDDRG